MFVRVDKKNIHLIIVYYNESLNFHICLYSLLILYYY